MKLRDLGIAEAFVFIRNWDQPRSFEGVPKKHEALKDYTDRVLKHVHAGCFSRSFLTQFPQRFRVYFFGFKNFEFTLITIFEPESELKVCKEVALKNSMDPLNFEVESVTVTKFLKEQGMSAHVDVYEWTFQNCCERSK